MGDLWILLFLPVSLVAFHGVKGCLECDPRFIDDIMTLLRHLVPAQVPGRAHLLARQHKEIIHLSSKVSHKDKTLRLMAVANAVKLRTWMKDEFYRLGNETWKGVFIIQGKLVKVRQNLEIKVKDTLRNFSEVACSEDCIVTEGPVLDCWSCFRMTTRCFRGDYCKGDVGCGMACEENPKKAENREISLYLILMAEAVILASAVLLFHICVLHRRKMKVIRSTLKTYLEKKLEELVGVIDKDEERNDLETWKSSSRSQTGNTSSVESEMQTGT